MKDSIALQGISIKYDCDGSSTKSNEHGMRAMQVRAYEKRGEQYLLIKSPPASGKSRALMFVALDKLNNQGIKKAIVTVPEKSIGASFANEPLSEFGFHYDWQVEPKWDLCDESDNNESKTESVRAFLASDDQILICPHATFRNAAEKFGIKIFDDCLVAIDEIHHSSANPDNKLGAAMVELIKRAKSHIVAMTGSFFRGDAVPVMSPSDEAKFATVTYTYYEQLNGYDHLKTLDIGHYFYSGSYMDSIAKVLNSKLKTIVHIPSVNSRESTKRGKVTEVAEIMETLGELQDEKDEATGFDLIKTPDGRILKVADLVEERPDRHAKVLAALKDKAQKDNRDNVDIIIALGMAKEGFDWIWCEHALTVGYRASLTEVIQIIGRVTRDAPDKPKAKFTNLIAEPDATLASVTQAVNDTLKAIAASLLMEQVLKPKLNFTSKTADNETLTVNKGNGEMTIAIKGLKEPTTDEGKRACEEDLPDIIAAVCQDTDIMQQGVFNQEAIPQEITMTRIGKIIEVLKPDLDKENAEAVRQRVAGALNVPHILEEASKAQDSANVSIIEAVKRYEMNVGELSIDMIDRINPFGRAYAIIAKSLDEQLLQQLEAKIAAKKSKLTLEEAAANAARAKDFLKKHGRLPALNSEDAWERLMAESIEVLKQKKQEKMQEEMNG